MIEKELRAFARHLLQNRNSMLGADWTVQGFGFMRLRISPDVRLHIWDSRLRVPTVSDIHDHAQWAFVSHILSGQLVNVRFLEDAGFDSTHHCSTIKCGIGGGSPVLGDDVRLVPQRPEIYEAGGKYEQLPQEIHRTYAADGTVTLITQHRTSLDTARVFFPLGTAWVDAIPRKATAREIDDIGAYALLIFK